MDLKLKNKKALVTAASYGLGFACAQTLSNEGAEVVICARDKSAVEEAAQKITNTSGNRVVGISADLTNEDDVKNLIDKTLEILGSVDILVLSTGHPPTFPFSTAKNDDWSEGFDLIMKPAIAITQTLVPLMKNQGYGRLIYIGSIFGLQPEVSSIVQSTFRTGMNSFSKCIATEFAAEGITANVICPGYFDTPLVAKLATKYAKEQNISIERVLESWKDYAPCKRFGSPEELAALVAYLASPLGGFCNGTSIVIDGGAIKQY